MNVSSQVKMEYPFPPNEFAQRVKLWKEAKGFTEMEDDIKAQEKQTLLGLRVLGDALDKNCEAYVEYPITDQEKAIECWYIIADLCNLIRCYATRGDFNGELFGLNVLFRILSEE